MALHMVENTKRPVVRPQAAPKSNQEKRKLELIQLETRYKSSFKLVRETKEETVVRLAIKPSDPDFPYEIDALQLQLNVPAEYPVKACTVQVLNSDIPKGFAINLEKGYSARVDPSSAHQTLVRQMNWLDRNMETLLQQAPAPTVRFIANSSRSQSSAETTQQQQQPQQPQKQFVDATARPIEGVTFNTPITQEKHTEDTTSAAASGSSSGSSSSSKPQPPKPKQDIPAQPKKVIPQKKYSAKELSTAEEKRKHEMKQLETRFCDSFRVVRSNANETVATLAIQINDTEFTHEQWLGGTEVYVKYHIPLLYPLEPCTLEIENKALDKTRASWIISGFNQHAENSHYTLFENLNWLNRNLESLLSTPPVQKTQEQLETDAIAIAQQRDLKPPVKAQQTPLSIAAPEFTPQQPQPSKKKISLFDEENDIKKNKVIFVNDPALISDQAKEGEVEVELAPEDSEEEESSEDSNNNNNNKVESSSTVNMAQPNVRRGVEVRLENPKLDNISLFRCTLLHIMVKCARCKDTVEVENIKPEEEGKPKNERWMSCPTCSSVLGIKFLGEYVHQGAMSIGLLQLAGCTAYDMLASAYIGTCGSCMEDMASTIRLSPHDPPRTISCFSCHAKMTCGLGDYHFVKIGSEGGERLKATEEQVMKLKKKKRSREDPLTIGEPLPDEGTCKHYRKSKRWFRFICCNKLYPCDICHDSREDHHSEMAKRHVCGLCSREQNIASGKPCVCGHEFEKGPQKNAFWEGGKGVRNKTAMSRKDPHKHKGLGKTTSKKQERVGAAGKERHQAEPSSSSAKD